MIKSLINSFLKLRLVVSSPDIRKTFARRSFMLFSRSDRMTRLLTRAFMQAKLTFEDLAALAGLSARTLTRVHTSKAPAPLETTAKMIRGLRRVFSRPVENLIAVAQEFECIQRAKNLVVLYMRIGHIGAGTPPLGVNITDDFGVGLVDVDGEAAETAARVIQLLQEMGRLPR